MADLPTPPDHLRNGKLAREDQIERDKQIAERFVAGETYAQLSRAFLISHGTVWAAIKRNGVALPNSKYGRAKVRSFDGRYVAVEAA